MTALVKGESVRTYLQSSLMRALLTGGEFPCGLVMPGTLLMLPSLELHISFLHLTIGILPPVNSVFCILQCSPLLLIEESYRSFM